MTRRVLAVGLLIGLLMNALGWVGNNIILGELWAGVGETLASTPWRASIWRDVLSLIPDFIYSVGIAWLYVALRPRYSSAVRAAVVSGVFVSVVGGINAYFAIANSAFIPWSLGLASFAVVLATGIPLALLAARMLAPSPAVAAPQVGP